MTTDSTTEHLPHALFASPTCRRPADLPGAGR
jgi:hypothetical protein